MYSAVLLATEPAAEEGTSNFLIPNGTFFVEVLIFLGILWFLGKKVVPRITTMLDARQRSIRHEIESAEQDRRELQEAKAQYAQALAQAHQEAAKIREEAAKTRSEIIEAAKAEARAEAEAVTRRAEERLEIERRQVLVELRREVGQLSAELASRIVGESLADQALQERIITRFIGELDEADATAATDAQQVH
jgi:F-type H+-transporting ATPase subunit b